MKNTNEDAILTFKKTRRPIIKFIIVFLAALGAVAVTVFYLEKDKQTTATNKVLNGEWQNFTSDIGKFSIIFPLPPTSSTNKNEIRGQEITNYSYSCDVSETENYSITYVTYPIEFDMTTNPKVNLENAMNGAVNNIEGGSLVSSDFVTVAGNPAVNYVISIPDQELYLKSRTILVGQTMYLINAIAKTANPPSFERFAESFRLN